MAFKYEVDYVVAGATGSNQLFETKKAAKKWIAELVRAWRDDIRDNKSWSGWKVDCSIQNSRKLYHPVFGWTEMVTLRDYK